jgi:signal transduction histidine kinase
MMAIVSHDLKNPLNTLHLRSHLMVQMLEGSSFEKDSLKRNLQMMQRTVRHMNQLIGDLTDVTKIQAGRLTLEKQECTVDEAVEPAIERTRLLARDKGIEFVTKLPPSDQMRIVADGARITQVMDNLLGNAMKFTPGGGRIEVTIAPIEKEFQISISDTGPGISTEALSHIFEPYWQVKKTRTGLGLGLFIAKTLVEAHGGRIWVESSVGRGTTFYFTLPAVYTMLNPRL